MPLSPTAEGAERAIALENQALEREMAQIIAQRAAIAASNDRSTPVPQRFRDAVTAARARLDRAEVAFTLADTNARLRIQREKPSPQLERLWYEQDTLSASNERERAKAVLVSAELQLGEQIQNRRTLEALEASAPAQRAEAERRYQDELNRIDREILLARQRCVE